MKILDGIGKGLNIVGKKTSEMASTAKLKLDITKHRTTIDKKYNEIGARYYFLRQENVSTDEMIETLIAEVSELYQAIDELESQIEAATLKEIDGMKCSNCDQTLTEDMKFCSACGVASNEVEKVCPRCESPVGESKYCGHCGKELI